MLGNRAQTKPQQVDEDVRVVAGGGEDGVALLTGELVAVNGVAVLDMADDGFNGGTAAHLALNSGRHAARLAGGADLEPVGKRTL